LSPAFASVLLITAVGTTGAATVPSAPPVSPLIAETLGRRTWRIEPPLRLSMNATFCPSIERTGDVVIGPPVPVWVSYDQATAGPLQSPVAVPPMSVVFAHIKPGKFSDKLMAFPAVPAFKAVTVTKLELEVAATSTPVVVVPPFRLIAAAMFVANWVVMTAADPDQYEKFKPVFTPSVAPVKVPLPQAKPLIVAVVPMLLPPVPAVFAVTVTVAPLDNAVTAATFLLIAAAMFAASVVVSVAVEKEVPVLVAGVPPLSVPPVQLNPVKLLESVMLFPATPPDTAVTVTVVVPLAVARVLPEFLVIALAMFVPSVPAVTPAAPDQI